MELISWVKIKTNIPKLFGVEIKLRSHLRKEKVHQNANVCEQGGLDF